MSAPRVLVAAESGCPEAALAHGAALAGREGAMVLMAVLVVPHAQPLEAVLDRSVAEACACLDRGERLAAGVARFDTRLVRARSLAEAVLDVLAAEPFDTLVLEAPRGGPRNGHRAQIEHLLERAPATVVLVRPG